MHDEDGSITRWFGTATDIHQEKLIATERELIARELDHRIKNLFALVGGLINLSVRDDPEIAPVASKLRQRLAALHQAHDFIRSGDRDEGTPEHAKSLQGLVRALLRPYESGREEQIRVEGDDVHLRVGFITPLALVFHELATNSAKYGALANAGGSLRLAFSRENDRLQVSWTETGSCNGCDPIGHAGFGSKLLTLVVESQLRGNYSRRRTPEGLAIELSLPLHDIVASRH